MTFGRGCFVIRRAERGAGTRAHSKAASQRNVKTRLGCQKRLQCRSGESFVMPLAESLLRSNPNGMKNILLGLLSKAKPADAENRTAWLQLDDNTPYPVAGPCSIGRAKSNSVTIPDEKVSRLHALVHAQDRGEHWLVDLGSCNGTYLNGQRVVHPIRLNDADAIQVGDHRIRFLLRTCCQGCRGLFAR